MKTAVFYAWFSVLNQSQMYTSSRHLSSIHTLSQECGFISCKDFPLIAQNNIFKKFALLSTLALSFR